jgi:hypothetical protein
MRTAGQLEGRLQGNEAREKRALLGLAHRAEVDGRRGVRGGQHDGRSRGAKRSSSRGSHVCRSISSRSRSRGSNARGAGSGKESVPASTQPAEKLEPRRLAAVARLRRRLERKRLVHKLDGQGDLHALHDRVELVAELQGQRGRGHHHRLVRRRQLEGLGRRGFGLLGHDAVVDGEGLPAVASVS